MHAKILCLLFAFYLFTFSDFRFHAPIKIAKHIESKITPEPELESLSNLHICQILHLSLTLSQSAEKTLNAADHPIHLP